MQFLYFRYRKFIVFGSFWCILFANKKVSLKMNCFWRTKPSILYLVESPSLNHTHQHTNKNIIVVKLSHSDQYIIIMCKDNSLHQQASWTCVHACTKSVNFIIIVIQVNIILNTIVKRNIYICTYHHQRSFSLSHGIFGTSNK